MEPSVAVRKAKQERKITGGRHKKTFEHMVVRGLHFLHAEACRLLSESEAEAKNVWLTVVETLHPHHSTFKDKLVNCCRATVS